MNNHSYIMPEEQLKNVLGITKPKQGNDKGLEKEIRKSNPIIDDCVCNNQMNGMPKAAIIAFCYGIAAFNIMMGNYNSNYSTTNKEDIAESGYETAFGNL